MIGLILKMLHVSDMIGISKNIDIAKGVDELPLTFNDAWKQRKRKRNQR